MTCPFCHAEAKRKVTKDCVIHKCVTCKAWQQYIPIANWPDAQKRFCPEEVRQAAKDIVEELI